jgi:hypothetical protein
MNHPEPLIPPGSESQPQIHRRTFLARTLISGIGVTALPQFVASSVLGADGTVAPSERVTVGLIGNGAMGSGHLRRLAYDPAFQLLAVCDVDAVRRESGRKAVDEIYSGKAAATYKGCLGCNDYREILARADIDAVLIATPDHWHTLASMHAAEAGKDIYCEKPLTVTLREGRELVEIVRRYKRVFQTGTQYRSIPAIRKTCKFVREGRLGKIKAVFTPYAPINSFLGGERAKPYQAVLNLAECGKAYAPMDFALPPEPVPEGLDWNLWVGPAPFRPYNRLYHVNPSPGVVPWSFCDAFGVTSSTWFLSHAVDVIQYALGYENSGPVEIIHPSSGQFPTLTCRYEDGTLVHFVDHWGIVKDVYKAVPASARLAGNFGGLFVGERGWLTNMSASGPLEASPESLFEEMGIVRTPEVNIGGNTHHANWLECIRTRKAPSADEEIGHRGASVGHLANITTILGQSLQWDPYTEQFKNNDFANRMLSRALRAPWRI